VAEPAPRRRGLRERLAPIRVRTTLAAVAVVALALAVGGVALITAMRRALDDEVLAGARLRAEDVAGVLEGGTAPGALAVENDEDQLIQVVDSDGRVVASSANVEGERPVARLEPGRSERVEVPIDDDEFLAVAVGAVTAAGTLTVIVARTTDSVRESVQVVAQLLTVGLPLLLVALAGITWRVIGRALSPVEALRREVEAISAAELHRRVPGSGAGDEIARLADTMNAMLARLEQAQARQQRFVSDAAHELRSPVASIRQHAEVAVAHPDAQTAEALGATVRDEAERVERLVDDLLVLARADEHTPARSRREVDLDDLVLAEAARLRAGGVEVDSTRVGAGRVHADARALGRVVRNLGDNAARHAAGRVRFGLRVEGPEVVLTVDDDGPGIPADERERVFERFVRLDDARSRDEGGSGLGLAIVAEVVRAHGGSVAASDAPLGGARMIVRLPGGG